MKQLILITMMLATQAVAAQNLSSIPRCEDCKQSQYVLFNQWQCGSSEGTKIMTYYFDDGVYRMNSALKRLKNLLSDNGHTYESPTNQDLYVSDIVGTDLEMLDITISAGSSYITKVWAIKDKYGNHVIDVLFQMNEENRVIAVIWK